MDVLSHFFFPFIAALFILGLHKRPRGVVDTARRETRIAYAVIFGLAGFAPDLDAATAPFRHIDGLYWLQHRGVSHTIIGAPVFGMIAVGGMHLLAKWRPARYGRYRFRPGFIPVAVLGSWTHLILDSVTYGGVPAFWPFSFDRTGINLYHWIIVWMFPLIAIVLILHLWKKIRLHHVAWCGVVFVALLIILAGVRIHYAPQFDTAEGFGDPEAEGLPEPFQVRVYTRSSIFEHTIVWPVPDGWMAGLYVNGEWENDIRYYPQRVDPGTEAAIALAKETNAYRGFRMGIIGPVATEAIWIDDGRIQVVFTDVAARFEATQNPRYTPAEVDTEWGYVAFHVENETVTALHKGW